MADISVIVNTWNEEKNIRRCLKSVGWASEIVVVDMYSGDKTVEIAKSLGAKVFSYKYTSYVEPARNFAISKATSDWILVLDADEEATPALARKLPALSKNPKGVTFFRLPRRNIIFGKWIKHSRWWPDYNLRFFRKGKVTWTDKIHGVPITKGEGSDVEAKIENAIIHYHYQSISQYLERLNRYTEIQAKELIDSGYEFLWQDILEKPTGEFLSRFFTGEGYKDGLHGLVLALLQAFSELILYSKIWEKENFKDQEITNLSEVFEKNINDYFYWQMRTSNLLTKLRLKIKRKI